MFKPIWGKEISGSGVTEEAWSCFGSGARKRTIQSSSFQLQQQFAKHQQIPTGTVEFEVKFSVTAWLSPIWIEVTIISALFLIFCTILFESLSVRSRTICWFVLKIDLRNEYRGRIWVVCFKNFQKKKSFENHKQIKLLLHVLFGFRKAILVRREYLTLF